MTAIAPLGEALRYIEMTGVFYSPSELTEPWGISIPPMEDCVWFHAITAGGGTLEVDGAMLEVGPGDLVLIPHGTGHRAWGATPAPTPDVFSLDNEYVNDTFAVLRHGGGGDATRVVCGGIRFSHPAARHLIEALPPIIGPIRSTRANWMQAILDLLAEEVQQTRPGSDAIVSRLCDIVVIQAIRTWIEQNPEAHTGWLRALHDENIGTALAQIHTNPQHDWTVGRLAEHAAMSRSAFAQRFTQLVGEPAMKYVTRWRMYVAADLLEQGDATVAAVAARVGYHSEAAFSRAFKRVMGATPRAAGRSKGPDPGPLRPAVGSAGLEPAT